MGLEATPARPSARPTPSQPNYRRLIDSPAFIVLVALLLRIAVISIGHTYRITLRQDHFQFGWEMGRIARSIASGRGFSSPTNFETGPTAWEPPLYPYLMAGIFRLFGTYSHASAWLLLTLNSIFSALTCLTIFRIAARIFGTTPARWAAWTWALFPYAIYWPVRVVWETSLSTFLLSLAFLLTLRIQKSAKRRDCVLLGLVWGLIALSNPALLSFMAFSLVWLWYCLRRGGLSATSNLLLVIVFFSLLITPWLVRNYHVFGEFVFIRDNFGMELHLANNEHSGGLWTRSEHPGNNPEQMRKFRDMGELAYMKEEKQAAATFIGEHPLQFLHFSLQRAIYFWIGNPQATLVGNWSLAPARHLAFLLSAIAAFVGLWLCGRNRVCGTLLFAVLLLIYPLPYYLAHPSPRYRHAIEPEMLLLIIYMFWQLRGRKLHLPLPTTG